MSGATFSVGRWRFFVNCHTMHTRMTSYRGYSDSFPVRSLVVLGCELSWWRK